MSISLLSELDKNHDITDDLESVYWVVLLGAMRMFTPPDKDIPMEIYDDAGVDGNGHLCGGDSKMDWLRDPSRLRALELCSPELLELLLDSQRCWLGFHLVRGGAKIHKHPDAETENILELASDPSFWIGKYRATLDSLACKERTPVVPLTQQLRILATLNHAPPPTSAPGHTSKEPANTQVDQQDPREVKENDGVSPGKPTGRKRRAEDLGPDLEAPVAPTRKLRRSCRHI